MGLPDSRDIEPIREDHTEDYNGEPVFVANFTEANDTERSPPNLDLLVDGDDNNGYLLLQTHDTLEEMPADDSDSSGTDEDENEFDFSNVEEEMADPVDQSGISQQIISADSELEAQVWNSPRSQDSIELNNEKTQQILNAMSKFNLPNVPDWANEVDPIELIQRIRNKELPTPSKRK